MALTRLNDFPIFPDDSSPRTYSESSTSSSCSLNDYGGKKYPKRVGIINVTNVTAVFINNHKKLNRSNSEPKARYNYRHPHGGNNMARYKTELCRSYEEVGDCKYADKCQYAHGESELRGLERHPKYKTELCRTFHAEGYCPYGARCHFIHRSKNAVSEALTAESFQDLSMSPSSLGSLSPASSQNAFSFGTVGVYSPPPSPIEGRLPVFKEISPPAFQYGGPYGGFAV